jgi:hypothetical protein
MHAAGDARDLDFIVRPTSTCSAGSFRHQLLMSKVTCGVP